MEGETMDSVSKNEIRGRIEYILSYLLSRKHNCDVKIYLKKEKITDGDSNQSNDIREK